ncbi:Endonuclease/exonuclease/phosphatase [Dipodascopsis uninucleata]
MHLNIKYWDDSREELAVRVYSHNIRYAAEHCFKGEEPWSVRKAHVAGSIAFNTINQLAVVLLQEVLHSQLCDLLELLGDDWTYTGVGRDDGSKAGEYAPILYRKSQFKVELKRTVWLSETPSVPSKGWDAASVRILNMILLNCKSKERVFYVLNTHLDDQGSLARKKSAQLIMKIIKSLESHDALVLAGDFNSEQDQDAYQIFSKDLKDGRTHSISKLMYGNTHTYTGFGDEKESVIDYIFVYPGVEVKSCSVLNNKFEDSPLSSDHRPVVCDIVIPNNKKNHDDVL